MEPTQAKPPRKRSRWLIVGLLLVLVSGVAWWQWPRGDARFVGRWTTDSTAPPTSILSLLSNGMGQVQDASGSTFAFRWRVDGDILTIGQRPDSKVSEALNRLIEDVAAKWNTRWCFEGWTMHVVRIEADRITLRSDEDQATVTYRRIPE